MDYDHVLTDEEIAAMMAFDCPSDSDCSILSDGEDVEEAEPITVQKATALSDLKLAEFDLGSEWLKNATQEVRDVLKSCDTPRPNENDTNLPTASSPSESDDLYLPGSSNQVSDPGEIGDHTYFDQNKPNHSPEQPETSVSSRPVRRPVRKLRKSMTSSDSQQIGNDLEQKPTRQPKKCPERSDLWFPGRENDFSQNPPKFHEVHEISVEGETPYEFFKFMFTENLFQHIAVESMRYASQDKSHPEWKVSVGELKVFLGINIVMTYIKYPACRMYWSSNQGLRLGLIANSVLSVNRFEEIKRFLHFVDNSNEEELKKDDKFWKIRPVISALHNSFHNAASPEENQSIDEMMVPFKGNSHLKQYLKNKPKKWGFKIWVKASSSGYVSCFELYQGATKKTAGSPFGPIGDVVLRLCHDIHGKNHKLFMDYLFTSISLIRQLREYKIFVIGTFRINRITKAIAEKLVDPKLLSRGDCSIITSLDNISIVRWMDNNPVHVISTYAGATPEDIVKRWDRSEKKHIEVNRPHCIKQYNLFMGGVDLMDRMIAHYPHGVKSKRWYLRIFFHVLNMGLVNAWILYRKKVDSKCPFLQFKASVAASLIAVGEACNNKRRVGRPSTDADEPQVKKRRIAPPKLPLEIRYDGIGHWSQKVSTNQAPRCHSRICKRRTRYTCKKCQEPVCPECMEDFHTK